jgi:CDP-paratose 2-epimerase
MKASLPARPGDGTSRGLRPNIVLITGGAGFVATNLADRLLRQGRPVMLFDNLSRAGVEQNVRWLRARHGSLVSVRIGDVRDAVAVRRAVRAACTIYHFAAQVAVTTSLVDPGLDFEVNARGALNLLEAIRTSDHRPPLLFTSTNKVYGELRDVPLRERGRRYEPIDARLGGTGIGEERPLDFHSPYGCSKGAAEQYVLDYARTFDLETVVFRMSCIYGPHQFGTEDQGWVAHFLIQALADLPLTIYGDGRQVRDVLYVEDLVEALLLAQARIAAIAGRAFNIGGGPGNTTSLLELIGLIEELIGESPRVTFEPWRAADQRYYVSDCGRFQAATGWRPRVALREGVARLRDWLLESRASADRPLVAGQVAS